MATITAVKSDCPASTVRYAIIKFDDRNRFGMGGVPATLLFAGGQRVIVYMKDATIEKAAVTSPEDLGLKVGHSSRTLDDAIRLAREVMADGRHVFLSGAGAEEFARDHALETAGPEWFATEARREALERMKAAAKG